MAIVSFEQIERLNREQAGPIKAGNRAQGPVSEGSRASLYDPLWGYYLFGQRVQMEYAEADVYRDNAEFTITGVFTHNAEVAKGAAPADDEEQLFNAIVAKYEALATAFDAAALAADPVDYGDWGTERDARCIVLPEPLRSSTGQRVYAHPTSITVDQTQFPTALRYTATLSEAKYNGGKLLLDGQMLDGAIIRIQPKHPVLAHKEIPAATGDVMQLKHWEAGRVQINGTVPNTRSVQSAIGPAAVALVAAAERGRVDVSLTYVDESGKAQVVPIWEELDLDEGGMGLDFEAEVVNVSLSGRF